MNKNKENQQDGSFKPNRINDQIKWSARPQLKGRGWIKMQDPTLPKCKEESREVGLKMVWREGGAFYTETEEIFPNCMLPTKNPF